MHLAVNRHPHKETCTHAHARSTNSFMSSWTFSALCSVCVLLFHSEGLLYAHLKAAECAAASAMREHDVSFSYLEQRCFPSDSEKSLLADKVYDTERQ